MSSQTVEQSSDHPAFPQPPNPAATIWRYMNAEKFDWLVENGRLFMPSACRLGDPLEGSTPLGELEWWKRQAADAGSDDARRIIRGNRDFLSRIAQRFRNHYSVSCWHVNEHENSAMWGCYTKAPEAVVIRSTYATLRSELPPYVEMGVVRYIDYATSRLPSMNVFEHITHKDIYYAFEQEVRAVATPPVVTELGLEKFEENLFELESSAGFRVYAPPVAIHRLIHGVVLHPDAPQPYAMKVRQLCASCGLPAPQCSRKRREPAF